MSEHAQAGVRRGRAARKAAALVSSAIAGLTIAACGSGSATPTVANLPAQHSGASGAPRNPLTTAQSDRDFVEFARCMRSHGVQMQDPQHRPGHSGLSINLPTQDAATASAYHACNPIIQPIVAAKAQAPPMPAAVLAALANYAQCMRSRDINMLDPTAYGQLNLGNVPGITSHFGRYSPQFHQADTTCRHLLPASVHDDGTGP